MKGTKMANRFLSFVLVFAMVITILPITALTVKAENANVLKADGWDFWTGEGGAGNLTNNEDGSVNIAVENEGWQNFAVQYTQGLELANGASYVLSGDFYSESDAKVLVNVQETLGWSSILPESPAVVDIVAGQTTHFEVTTNAASANFTKNGKLALMFGSGTGNAGKTIKVSNMSLVQIGEASEPTPVEPEEPVEPNLGNGEYLNLETAVTELYVGSDWAGTSAAVKETGTKAELNVGSYGWNGEWGLQYMIEELNFTDNETYTVAFEITSTIDKNILVKLDDAGHIVDTLNLKANETYSYVKAVKCPSFKDNKLYFALGQMSGEAANLSGILTIDKLSITDSNGNAVTSGSGEPTVGGSEYDFVATEENAKNDCADPGKVKDGYDLIWADEFDGNYGNDNVDSNTGLNLNNWAYQLGDGTTDCGNTGWGNQELQCYTKDKDNVAVNEDLNGDGTADGLLRITAQYEENGYNYAGESTKRYTSARLRSTTATDALFNLTYGYIESRISVPATQGAWPAFWMLPQSTSIYGSWPVSGEIDILETCGGFSSKLHNIACGTLHWGTPNHVYKGSGYVNLDSDYTYFHTYAIDWKPGEITWYYDGKAIYTSTNWASAIPGASDSLSFDAPFDEPFYMLLNLAVDSGNFGGSANKANFAGDINMYVDYVRCFQKTEGYADYAVRTASGSSADDWKEYAGQNQIAEIKADNVLVAPNGDVNSLEATGELKADSWYLGYQADASNATVDTIADDNGKTWAKVGVNTAGAQDYSVQLIGHYNAKAGYVYKVSFDAYADGALVGQSVNCDSKEWRGWSTYGITNVALKDAPTEYEFLMAQEEDFDDCRIEFNVGAKGTGNVYVSNVKVEIVNPDSISQESSKRTMLADGNLVYNGTFDQGHKHFGYWTAADNTEVSIPRYTTEKIADTDVSVVDIASKTNYEKVADGVKYYERRAQISGKTDSDKPVVYQSGIKMIADEYTINYDLFSKKDTTVDVAIYSVKDANGTEQLDKQLVHKTTNYSAEKQLQKRSVKLALAEDVENAAVVFTFANGTKVQMDNVSLYGASQSIPVDENPLNCESTWGGDNGGGGKLDLVKADGAYTLENVASGGTWYTPQIVSNDFSLVAGKEYKLSFKYKMDGPSNNTLQYIIQENSGSWHVYNNGPTTVEYDSAKADENGYCSYEVTFGADISLDTVHMVFGLGNSGGVGTLNFSFKDADISIVKDESIEDEPVVDEPVVDEPSDDPTVEQPSDEEDDAENEDDAEKEEKKDNVITGVKDSYNKVVGNKAFTLKAKANGADISYSTSNSKVVAVDKKTGKITIVGPGKATVTITAAENNSYKAATKTVVITVTPKKLNIKSVKSPKKANLSIKWGKQSLVSGYQLQVSTSKKFATKKTKTIKVVGASKTSKTISKLKANTKYYVRIRSYKKVNNSKTLYGAWSSVKTARTKR